mmetsp:Transcript_22003/g.39427  ORF Transcript_22003/g.39427 Transcript_22003/m.39427 type:complete len:216 (-) Transcript_22003:9-656(-)
MVGFTQILNIWRQLGLSLRRRCAAICSLCICISSMTSFAATATAPGWRGSGSCRGSHSHCRTFLPSLLLSLSCICRCWRCCFCSCCFTFGPFPSTLCAFLRCCLASLLADDVAKPSCKWHALILKEGFQLRLDLFRRPARLEHNSDVLREDIEFPIASNNALQLFHDHLVDRSLPICRKLTVKLGKVRHLRFLAHGAAAARAPSQLFPKTCCELV